MTLSSLSLLFLIGCVLCHEQHFLNNLLDDIEPDELDLQPGERAMHMSMPKSSSSSPPSLFDGLWVNQGGMPVARAHPGSLVTIGMPVNLFPNTMSPEEAGQAVRTAASKGAIIVMIPAKLDSTGIKVTIDGGAGICRGSFCPGTGSAPITDEGAPISSSNSTANYYFPAPNRVPVAVHSVFNTMPRDF